MTTIRDFMDQADSGKLILPSIQREYVWTEEQICRLFDSIMSDYPIGHMMLWELNGTKIKEKGIEFYKLLNSYNEKNPENNEKVSNASPRSTYFAILDGQQRTQSLYIGLRGYLRLKLYRARKSNDAAYKEKYLYINLLKETDITEDHKYEFKFIADEELKLEENKSKLLFKVGEILQYEESPKLIDALKIEDNYTKEQLEEAQETLNQLFRKMNEDATIIHWDKIDTDKSLDEVLNIFVRTNSGGTILSKTDLLFSTVVANWTDAKSKIEELIDTVNNKGGQDTRYKFSKDFIMRTLMYLLDEPVTLKIKDIKSNIKKMEENWDSLKKAIIDVRSILKYSGYNSENLIAYNAVMPIIYYLYKGGKLDIKGDINPKEELKKYLVVSHMKRLYGVASNSTLTSVRTALVDEVGKLKNKYFKLSDLKDVKIVGERNFEVNEEIVESWFEENLSDYTFMILTLLYPCANIETVNYEQDHMHPKSKLEKTKFAPLKNRLANLQLLPKPENGSKNDDDLEEWLKDKERKQSAKFLPNCSYKLEDYETFLEEREKLMKKELLKVLKLK